MFRIKVLIVTLALICAQSQAERATYVSLPNSYHRVTTLNFFDDKVLEEDLGFELFNCNDEQFYCSISREFTFSLPKQRIKVGDKWEHADVRFDYVAETLMTFLDEIIPVEVIESSHNIVFYFSVEKGLLTYIKISEKQDQVLSLFGDVGVGHDWEINLSRNKKLQENNKEEHP